MLLCFKLSSQPIALKKFLGKYCFYGCWCFPRGQLIMGYGQPVDDIDNTCRNHQVNIYMAFGLNINFSKYCQTIFIWRKIQHSFFCISMGWVVGCLKTFNAGSLSNCLLSSNRFDFKRNFSVLKSAQNPTLFAVFLSR